LSPSINTANFCCSDCSVIVLLSQLPVHHPTITIPNGLFWFMIELYHRESKIRIKKHVALNMAAPNLPSPCFCREAPHISECRHCLFMRCYPVILSAFCNGSGPTPAEKTAPFESIPHSHAFGNTYTVILPDSCLSWLNDRNYLIYICLSLYF